MRSLVMISTAIVISVACRSVSALTVPGRACVQFAGQTTVPDMGYGETAASIPPYINVCGGGMVSVGAAGLWSHGPAPGSGPDGYGAYDDTYEAYVNLGGISRVIAPLNTLVGVFLTDDPPSPGDIPPTLQLGVDDMTSPELQQAFAIGSSLDNISVPPGATRLFLGLNDGYEWSNNWGDVYVDVTIVNCPPDCSNAMPSIATLWSPNHKFVEISILGVTDPDGDPVTITIDSIYQDEPVDSTGDGAFAPDGMGLGTSTAEVRAERDGAGNGRVYHISFTADDGNGGTCSGEVLVSVPNSQGKNGAAVDDGALYDSTVP